MQCTVQPKAHTGSTREKQAGKPKKKSQKTAQKLVNKRKNEQAGQKKGKTKRHKNWSTREKQAGKLNRNFVTAEMSRATTYFHGFSSIANYS